MVIVVLASSVIVVALVISRFVRPNDDSILRHQRALAAMCEAERRHPSSSVEKTPAPARTDHVHMLDEAPANTVSARLRPRPSARRLPAGRRRNAAKIAARPTIACLPTTYLATVSLSTPASTPAANDLVPATIAPDPSEPTEPIKTE